MLLPQLKSTVKFAKRRFYASVTFLGVRSLHQLTCLVNHSLAQCTSPVVTYVNR